jgi:hypothetical protein
MEVSLDERLQFRREGAFFALQKYLPDITKVPALQLREITREAFQVWFGQHNPDVVLGHLPEAMDWIRASGAKIPKSHAFVCLNSLRTSGNCATLDFQTPVLGGRACELVIGQLLHNEFGVPSQLSLTTIPARLIEGPTLRPRATVKTAGAALAAQRSTPNA